MKTIITFDLEDENYVRANGRHRWILQPQAIRPLTSEVPDVDGLGDPCWTGDQWVEPYASRVLSAVMERLLTAISDGNVQEAAGQRRVELGKIRLPHVT